MAKFCAQCGAPLNDEDKVCGQCGTFVRGEAPVAGEAPAAAPVNPIPTPGPVNPVPAAESAKKPKDKMTQIIILIGAALAAIVLLVIAVNVIGNFTGYKGALRKMVKAVQDYDMDAVSAIASSISDEAYDDYYGDADEAYDKKVSAALDKYEDQVGIIKKIKFEITDATELSKRKTEDIKDKLIDNYNMDTSKIKKIVKLEVTLTVKGAKKTSSYRSDDLYAIKEGGGWKLCDLSLD